MAEVVVMPQDVKKDFQELNKQVSRFRKEAVAIGVCALGCVYVANIPNSLGVNIAIGTFVAMNVVATGFAQFHLILQYSARGLPQIAVSRNASE